MFLRSIQYTIYKWCIEMHIGEGTEHVPAEGIQRYSFVTPLAIPLDIHFRKIARKTAVRG